MSTKDPSPNTIIIRCILVAFVPLLLAAVTAFSLLRHDLLEETGRAHVALARSVAGEVDASIYEASNLVRHVAEVMEQKERLGTRDMDFYLESEIRGTSVLEGLFVLGRDGRVVHAGVAGHLHRNRADFLGADLSGLAVYRQALEQQTMRWSGLVKSVVSGEPVIMLAQPAGNGMVVMGSLDLREFRKVIQRLMADTGACMLIADGNGRIIAHCDDAAVARQTSVAHLTMFREGLAGGSGPYRYRFGGDKIGAPVLIRETGWLVAVESGVRNILWPVHKSGSVLLAGLVLAGVLVITVVRRGASPS